VQTARTAFLLSLTWSFVWAWSLYGFGLGYIHDHASHVAKISARLRTAANDQDWKAHLCRTYLAAVHGRSDAAPLSDGELKDCRHYFATTGSGVWKWAESLGTSPSGGAAAKAASPSPADEAWYRERCRILLVEKAEESRQAPPGLPLSNDKLSECDEHFRRVIADEQKWTTELAREARMVAFPGGFGRTTVADLSVLGQAGLALIMAWWFFGSRRENHAIRAIVDRDGGPAVKRRGTAKKFVLVPQDRFLSAEHLAFAYHSVAQRFLFLASSPTPLPRAFSTALVYLPLAIATWNVVTDLLDIWQFRSLLSSAVFVRLAVEILLWSLLAAMTAAILATETDTSAILNGWYLAVKHVWMERWDESTMDPACAVLVDARAQEASPWTPEDAAFAS
jgi:hypothetical protein